MSFYQQIAPYYHHIFKINVQQIEFIKSKIPNPDSNIIDVGCGIGTLSFELGSYYKHILGIDMDFEMIQAALRNTKSTLNTIQFQQLSMLDLNTIKDKNTIDGIICFGNTLVHLSSFDAVVDFLKQARVILKSSGKLLLQIVNYDKVLSKNITQLPLIDNEDIVFERYYSYRKSENKIDFNTRLTVKTTQELIENSISLLPLLQDQLADLLKNADFNNCNFFGNFNQVAYDLDSPALIIEAW
ncbi:class I SAM-dependent methyltransferase [Mariniflexile sp.]|uniref:class I SAM-dependent methyltransferase n=1 Tax=Mariniflexile sp. TaxID=1979402 RepID=UPI0035626598